MMQQKNWTDNGVTNKERFGYGLASMGSHLSNRSISSYLLMFYTNCLLLDPKAAGLIFLIGRLVDAVTDILMATISDKTRTRFGTYRPYVLFGAIPLAITFVLCFSYPSFLDSIGKKLVWAYVMYFLETSVFNTICGMNHGALAAVVTKQPTGRAKLASARTMGENLAVLLISALTMTLVLRYGGTNNPEGWQRMAVLFAVMIAACYIIGTLMIKEHYKVVPPGQKAASLKQRFQCLKGNTPFFALVLCVLSSMLVSVFCGISFGYYCMYNLGHAEWIAPLTTISCVFGIAAALVMPLLVRKFEKRHVLLLGCCMNILAVIILVNTENYAGALAYEIIGPGAGDAFVLSAIWSMVPDAADYGAWKNKIASPGIVYSVNMFVIKMAGGLGAYFVGFILSLFSFDAEAAVQTPETLFALRQAMLYVTIILCVIGILLTFGCRKIDKARMKIVQAESEPSEPSEPRGLSPGP